MLKRNGEDCEHPVPNYPGLLTASEFKSYNVAVPLVAVEVRLFNERATTLSEIEKQSAGTAEQVTSQVARDLPSLTVKGKPESEWKIRHVLIKSARSEMLFCSRDHEGEQQFGVVEKFDPQITLRPCSRRHGFADDGQQRICPVAKLCGKRAQRSSTFPQRH